MIDIVGYEAVQNGHTYRYHAACVLRLRLFDDPTMPEIEDCEAIFHGDPRDGLACGVCGVPLRDRAPVEGGCDVRLS